MHRRCRACRRPARWRYPLVASADSDASPRPDRRVKGCLLASGYWPPGPFRPEPVVRTTGPGKGFRVDQPPLNAMLQSALDCGDDRELRTALAAGSGLPGPGLNLRLVHELAGAVGDVVQRADPPVKRLAGLLNGWARLSVDEAPGDRPEVILPCVAVAAYGEVAAARPDCWDDEMAKLRRAAGELRGWTRDDDPLVVRAAAAGVAEPRLLGEGARAAPPLRCRAVTDPNPDAAATDQRDPTVDRATVTIAAPAETVWDMVADVTRMGEWSPECYACRWIGKRRGPVAGARFAGFNKRGWVRWVTTNEVVEAERGRAFV